MPIIPMWETARGGRSDEGGSGSARRGRIGRVASHLTMLHLEGPCCVAIQRRTCIYKYIHLHLTNVNTTGGQHPSTRGPRRHQRTLQNDERGRESGASLLLSPNTLRCCARWVAVLGRDGPQSPVLSGQTMMFILGALAWLSSWMV